MFVTGSVSHPGRALVELVIDSTSDMAGEPFIFKPDPVIQSMNPEGSIFRFVGPHLHFTDVDLATSRMQPVLKLLPNHMYI